MVKKVKNTLKKLCPLCPLHIEIGKVDIIKSGQSGQMKYKILINDFSNVTFNVDHPKLTSLLPV